MALAHRLKIKLVECAKRLLSECYVQDVLAKHHIKCYAKAGIIFIHIPKCAGSSIASCIYGRRNGHLKVDLIRRYMGSHYDATPSFAVTRDPYERLQSAYRFALAGSIRDGAIKNPELYRTREFATFDTFVREWLALRDLNNVDPVFTPQAAFISTNGRIDVNDVFKIEQKKSLEKYLSCMLRKSVFLPSKNVNKVYNDKVKISDEAKAVIWPLYRQDFELLGYQP
jgi:hypothetical protein